MDRKEALKLATALLGGTLVGGEMFLTGCSSRTSAKNFVTKEDVLLLDEIGEVILPETEDSPGAKAADIGLFMQKIVADCYRDSERKVFVEGLTTIRDRSSNDFGRSFMELTGSERFDFVVKLDEEARANQNFAKDNPHYFTLIKQLTLWGYFTSEPGCTQALRYIQTPRHYSGCTPYQQGEKAWAI